MIGSARTAPLASCRATATIDARWGNGFVATVTVRNTGRNPGPLARLLAVVR